MTKYRVEYREVMKNWKRWSNIKSNLKEKKLTAQLALEKEVLVSLREEQQTEATAALGFEEHALEEMIALGSTTPGRGLGHGRDVHPSAGELLQGS